MSELRARRDGRELKMKAATIVLLLILMASMLAACSSSNSTPTELPSLKIAPAPPGSCNLDAKKMCGSFGSLAAGSVSTTAAQQTTYASATAPESMEFQIPAGQAIKLMCYYDQQHASVIRADATAESPLTDNSVAYLKGQGFCAQK